MKITPELVHPQIRRDIEGLISVHGAGSVQVFEYIHRVSLSARSPFEIDTFLYALVADAYRLSHRLVNDRDDIHRVAGSKRNYGRGVPTWDTTFDLALRLAKEISVKDNTHVGRRAYDAVKTYREHEEAKAANLEQQEHLQIEYSRRPWTRAFLVTDGHVHRSTSCTTCFPTTEFTWLPFLSGRDEAEIVSLAGERACTVCYPTAPTLRDYEKASPLFTEEEAERAKQREQRAAEKDARTAKKIAAGLTADGSEFVCSYVEHNARVWDGATREYVVRDHERTERFKTEKAAVQWVVQQICWGEERYSYQRPAWDAIAEAVATKHGKTTDEVWVEIRAKVAAKNKRDSRGY